MQGEEQKGAGVSGHLCVRKPWPGMARTIFGDHEKFLDVYYRPYPGLYFSGDGALRDDSGDYQITGRVDDVINVKGHRLGTAEIESFMVRQRGLFKIISTCDDLLATVSILSYVNA